MHETKEKLEHVLEMKKTLAEWAKEELDKGKEHVCTHEMGDVIDMIKDLSEVEKNCWKACYYKHVIEAMIEADPEDWMNEEFLEMLEERMGYPRGSHHVGHRFSPSKHPRSSTGRFVSTGGHTTGHMGGRMGYWDPDYIHYNEMVPGHEHLRYDDHLMMQHPYEKYKEAKRHYTETHDQKHKDEMDMAANEHMASTISSVREIWRYADPEMRKRLKTDLTSLVNEMGT